MLTTCSAVVDEPCPVMSDDVDTPRHPAPVRAALLAALLMTGCAGRSRGSDASELLAAGWIDSDPMGAATEADPERLAALADAGLRGRILRLDRLLDLYDAARFADDRQARESLWLALGGHASTRGIEASREAVLRLLDEAYAIEDLATRTDPPDLSEPELRFVADAIMLLSTDMFLPDTAEALITATLAYRVLAEEGHPRIADNAHWRLYDHVRGVLEGAVEMTPAVRADVVVHALYVEREDISAWLDDLAPHARPPLPSPSELWALLEQHRDALAPIDRWQPVLATRVEREANLQETVMALLPRPRDTSWRLVELARGTAASESLAPAVVLEPGRAQIESRAFEPAAIESAALEGLLARDGRGILLLASAPDVPAPEYAATLRALAQARTTTIELAVHEPALPPSESEAPGKVVVALPLYVALPDDAGAGARALRDSRIHVQLTGRGPRFRVDGRWLGASPTLPSDLVAFVDKLRRAYPRQHALSLSLGDDVQHQQLVDLLAALSGGRSPAFVAVGWLPDAAIEREPVTDPLGERTLAARVELGSDAIAIVMPELPAGVPEQDWARVRTASESLRACIPELEVALPKSGLGVQLDFLDHELADLVARGVASGRKLGTASLERFESCANDRLAGFRLREHEAALQVELLVRPGG
jgi:hypothetical protein